MMTMMIIMMMAMDRTDYQLIPCLSVIIAAQISTTFLKFITDIHSYGNNQTLLPNKRFKSVLG